MKAFSLSKDIAAWENTLFPVDVEECDTGDNCKIFCTNLQIFTVTGQYGMYNLHVLFMQ